MKKIVFLILILSAVCSAHDHVDVGTAPGNAGRLGLDGPGSQLSCYVPIGEFFSGYTPNFPGGWHASELTFTTETNTLDQAAGVNATIELVSVSGPAGGIFAFWEVGAKTPTWSRSTEWNSGLGNVPSFPVVFNGDTHAHGRAFTMDKPGDYTVRFRAVDSNGAYATSANMTIVFRAQQPPQLSIGISGGNVSLSFRSRQNLKYYLQGCDDLVAGVWSPVELTDQNTFIDGQGDVKNPSDPLIGRPRAFYRLVEYY
ncbi:MAG: hypothetical protein ACKOAS_07340 [Verrucomicrobiota bacterium]